ncbi:hypothetical protein [Hyphomicrobium sp. CS1GBMeth3]|uniref:hypothetical protein n=1 Tax=Hyphomicrobium sp. CS1GBMeth3 TaxID=1892845 RepID=UPI000930F4A5|nr:hypothetical protein [Hyphomicrobium sp. CS1GBMeth3]
MPSVRRTPRLPGAGKGKRSAEREELEQLRQRKLAEREAHEISADIQQFKDDMGWMLERNLTFVELVKCWIATNNEIYIEAAVQLYRDGLADECAKDPSAQSDKQIGMDALLGIYAAHLRETGINPTRAYEHAAAQLGVPADSADGGHPLVAAAKTVYRSYDKYGRATTLADFAQGLLAQMSLCRDLRRRCDEVA